MSTVSDPAYHDEIARLTPRLRRLARALVRNNGSDVSDNLVRATLLRAVGADQARRGSRLMIWLVSVMTELHREQVRELSADKRFRSSVSDTQAVQNGSRWRAASAVRPPSTTLLSAIPLECREVLLLVVLEKMSYGDVAESLGISLNTVVTRLTRAREVLGQSQSSAPAHAATVPHLGRAGPPHLRVVK